MQNAAARGQEVRPHYASLARTSLASGSQAHRLQAVGDGLQVSARTGVTITWLLTVCRSPRWRADIFDLLCPALHLAEGTTQSLEEQFGTISRPIAVTVVIWTKTETVFV